MDKTFKLLVDLDHKAFLASDAIQYTAGEYDRAKSAYDGLSREDDHLNGPHDDGFFLADTVEDAIEESAERLENVRNGIREFDRYLAQLIYIRGQLAEETGIPLMSHMGTSEFGRESAEILM